MDLTEIKTIRLSYEPGADELSVTTGNTSVAATQEPYPGLVVELNTEHEAIGFRIAGFNSLIHAMSLRLAALPSEPAQPLPREQPDPSTPEETAARLGARSTTWQCYPRLD
ncbi:MAG TPA: hypothetical protein VGS41_16830 [Chthonomonadales bacterium]|nr:hypothetical protein [Chthonomonadales bacterium]